MANQKPKKSGKKAEKPAVSPETKKEMKETAEVKETTSVAVASTQTKPFAGFFARKCDKNENILTIFKTPRIWGALLAELVGTMLMVMMLLTLGLDPLYVVVCGVVIYAVLVGLSGANLNPLVTVGMMATRRMSAIRGVLYILAQLLGGWIGLIIINAFRLGSGTTNELPAMTEITGEAFWAVALVELMGAIVITFCFARALGFARKNPLAFAIAVVGGISLATVFGYVISRSFFLMTNSYIFNPVAALMYQILPTAADSFGELAQAAGLAAAAYIIFPMIGGVIGFYLSDVMTRLAGNGYFCACDDVCPCDDRSNKC